jgi:hypothetical protein
MRMAAAALPHSLSPLVLVALVAGLACVQSVFGVGLLVFGTPILLLLGVPFPVVLAYLLPASLAISTAQVASSGGFALDHTRRCLLLVTAPAVVVGTVLVLNVVGHVDLKPAVGVMLLATAVIRTVPRLTEPLARLTRAHLHVLAGVLGLVHGLSNLGGGLLTVIAGSLYQRKEDIRRQIAFGYGLMAALQLAVLFLVQRPRIDAVLWLTLPAVALTAYSLVGRRLFGAAQQRAYRVGLTGLITTFGALMVLRV